MAQLQKRRKTVMSPYIPRIKLQYNKVKLPIKIQKYRIRKVIIQQEDYKLNTSSIYEGMGKREEKKQ